MNIIAIVGHMGSGKTLYMTYLALQDFKTGRKLFSNYGLKKGIKYEPFNKQFLVDYSSGNEGLMNCTVLADEFHIWLDSRNHASKQNKLISYMINQCRKRSVDFIFTTQSIDQVDVRLRRAISLIVEPKLIKLSDKKSILRINHIHQNGAKRSFDIKNAQDLFSYYDTNEIIDFE